MLSATVPAACQPRARRCGRHQAAQGPQYPQGGQNIRSGDQEERRTPPAAPAAAPAVCPSPKSRPALGHAQPLPAAPASCLPQHTAPKVRGRVTRAASAAAGPRTRHRSVPASAAALCTAVVDACSARRLTPGGANRLRPQRAEVAARCVGGQPSARSAGPQPTLTSCSAEDAASTAAFKLTGCSRHANQ